LENPADGSGRINAQWLQFAKKKQAQDMVKVGAGQHNASNRRLANAFRGMKGSGGFDLRPEIGRGTKQKPGATVSTNR